MEFVEIFTDGACLGNPGPGGWAVLLRANAQEREIVGAEVHTTNNRMELMAAIAGLEALRHRSRVRVITDSQYVKNGITIWLVDWKKRHWMTASRKPVKNRDLWQRLDRVQTDHEIEWYWVRGHSGCAENERVDRLARAAATRGVSTAT